jgi:para-nitrobenzyl esterase
MKLILICISFFLLGQNIAQQPFAVVQTQSGKISGGINGSGSHVFKGIPFAAPPVGDLRWKSPQPVKSWEGTKNCDQFGASPMQGKPVPFGPWTKPYLIPETPISEDCLYLNVWTAAKSDIEKRPVLVWIYGGGFSSGGSGCQIYDGDAMASAGVVFVSINYRVGIFGFYAHPELTKESGVNASGNYGLMDQVAALQWVKKNISTFGGDPNNVTIAGQSAGSMSVNCLVASPLAKDLFNKAIAQSGASFTRTNGVLADAEKEGLKLAAGASLAEMRNIAADSLMKKVSGFRGPIIDGYVLPEQIADIFEKGKANNVALLTGWNQDEGLMFGPPKNAENFRKDMGKMYGVDSARFLSYYPATNDEEAAKSQNSLSRDQTFGMQNYIWASKQSSQNKKVFVYRFTRKVPAEGEYAKYGAFHTGEVPYAYNNLKYGDRLYQPADQELATLMSSYWSNFIKTGDPNGKGLPVWPAFKLAEKQVMFFDEKSGAGSMKDAAQLDLIYSKMKKN